MGTMRLERHAALAIVFARVLRGNITNRVQIYRKRFIMKKWLV